MDAPTAPGIAHDGPALRTVGLTKHYGDVVALSDLTVDVGPAEVFGFLGPNGAGKTTAIRTVLDELHPTSGTATVLGMDSHRQSVEIRHHIGYLPGDLALYPDLTGHDTLTFFANLRGGVDWAVVEGLAERLDADLTRKVGELSTGNRQKIGLVQALMNEPELVIMDEPSAGLDPLVQHELQAILREIVEEGRTVFLSSHTLSEVQRVADRVGIIRHGRLVAVETLADLRAMAARRVELVCRQPVDRAVLESVPGVSEAAVDGGRCVFAFAGNMSELLVVMSGGHEIIDITTRDADLEEIFLTYYRDDPGDGIGTRGSAGPC